MITQSDYIEIKKRLQNIKTRIQFRNADKIDSLGYEGSIGEPILLKDKLTFSVCDGRSIDNRKEYEITKSAPNLDSLSEYLEHMILFFLEKTPVGALTAKFAREGSILTRSKLIETFTNTNKFCIPDGRSLPSNCYACKVLGISYAPDLSGRFLRHYDPSGSTDSDGSRSLGHKQSDSLKKHRHSIDTSQINFTGKLVADYDYLGRDKDRYWSKGDTEFVIDLEFGDEISSDGLFVPLTKEMGFPETRARNICYISFYRYDL
ncbi:MULTISPECIES: hypothetical protein [Borreliella]|uniref:hypothetical protein n=1 Tax=Borreliella TaxID=64895 RepID=UPI00016B2D90|nr:hypothetical protein [Borreliella garinii]ACJ73346.1 conserved hypothetical protein [Borreliella afzelii ACA-1]